MNRPHSAYPCSCPGTLGFLPPVNNAAMNTMYKYPFETLLPIPLVIHSEVGPLDPMLILFYVSKNCFHRGCTILRSHLQCRRDSGSPHHHQHLLLRCFYSSRPNGVRWYPDFDLHFPNDLMITVGKHLCMGFLAICVFFSHSVG